MNSPALRAEEFETVSDTIEGWPVRVVCYRIGERYFASVESVDPGARIARAERGTREEAVRVAREKAERRLRRRQ
jgi:hypothetical protein